MGQPATEHKNGDGNAPAYLHGLNPGQQRAVLHADGPLLVIAGAGSGKTRTLASRVARLIAEGTPAERILLLTFTRRASKEMLARAGRLVRDRAVGKVVGGTFHAAANRLLRQYGTAVGLRSGFTVLDQGDSADLMGLLREEHGLAERERRFPRKETVASIYSRVVNAQRPLTEVVERDFPWCRDEVDGLREVFAAYTERKHANNVVDFDDLLLYWRALVTQSAVAGTIRGMFDHVLVDEYQDTNRLQADILAGVMPDGRGLTVVGDDAQAIYSFRAATVENILEFPERFPGTTLVTLDQNYRSTPEVLQTANAVLAAAPRSYPKQLWSARPSGARPSLTIAEDEGDQARLVADRILAHREAGIRLIEQAVLFRTGHHSDGLELELSRRDIPFVKFGGLQFLEAAHIKDVLAMLRVLDNPTDELAWHRVLRLLDGIGPATSQRLLDQVLGSPTPPEAVLPRFLEEELDGVPPRAVDDLALLRTALGEAHGGSGPEPPPAVQLERFVDLCERVFVRRYDDAGARLADVAQLSDIARAYPSRGRFLAELTLDPPSSTSDLAGPPHLDDDYVTLSTIHSAKGGEWRAVHVIHAADGNIPSDMALRDAEGLEEERRLLYVALTRAQDHLHVTYPLRFYHRRFDMDDAHTYAQPSRFLEPARDTFDQVGGDPVAQEPVQVSADPVRVALDGLFAG